MSLTTHWRVAAWTLPTVGTTTQIDPSLPIVAASIQDTDDARIRGSITLDGTYPIDDILHVDPSDIAAGKACLIRLYRPGQTLPDFEFKGGRYQREISELGVETIKLFGAGWRMAGLDEAVVRWWDWETGAVRTRFPDHVYGDTNLIPNPSGTDNILNERQRIHIDGVFRSTPLDGAITDSATTIDVDDASVYFADTPFSILIDSEQLRVTGVASNQLTVTRGFAGTTAVAHDDDILVHEVPSDSFALTFDGETTTDINWNPHAGDKATFHTDPEAIDAALVALTNVITVAVEVEEFYDSRGIFDHADIWVEFIDPGEQALALMASTTPTSCQPNTVTRVAKGGAGDPYPWTVSRNPNTGLVHGRDTIIRASDTSLGEPADCIVVIPTRRYGGAQVVLEVPPGALAQSEVEVQPTVEGDFRFVLRDLNEKFVAADPSESGGTTLSTGVFTEMSVTDVVIPNTTTRIIVRIATVDTDEAAWAKFYIRNGNFELGHGAQVIGVVADDLLDDAQSDHPAVAKLGWLTVRNYTGLVDADGVAWVRSEAIRARRGQKYGTHVWSRLFGDLGYEHDIRPHSETAWTMDLWNPGGRGSDKSTSIEFLVGSGVGGGPMAGRIPGATRILAEGADGLISEVSDTDSETAFGIWESYLSDGDIANAGSLDALAQHALDEDVENQLALTVELVGENAPIPYEKFKVGDTCGFNIVGRAARHTRRISEIQLRCRTVEGETRWSATVTASRLFLAGDEANTEAIWDLLTRFERQALKDAAKSFGTDKAPPPVPLGGDSTGAYIQLARSAPQSIAAGGEPIEWDRLDILGALRFDTNVPAIEKRIQVPGYYNLKFSGEWSTFDGGGTVWVTRNGATIWPPLDEATGVWSSDDGRVFTPEVSHAFACRAGDIIRVHIDPGGSGQTLQRATCSLYLVQPISSECIPAVVADWHFEETGGTTAADSVGSHDGTYVNSPTLGTAGPSGDLAATFDDASSQYVSVPDSADFDVFAGGLTVEAWLKTHATGTANGQGADIVSHGRDAVTGNFNFALYECELHSNCEIQFGVGHDGGSDKHAAVTSGFRDGAYHHIAGTWDGAFVRIYMDGVLIEAVAAAVTMNALDNPLYIARNPVPDNENGYFDGDIARVRLWTCALDATEIVRIYSEGSR